MNDGAELAFGPALKQRQVWALAVKILGFGSQALVVVASLLGGILAFRQGAPLFLWFVVAAKFAAHAPFVQATRFSLHLATILCAYAAVALVWAVDWEGGGTLGARPA